MRGAEIFIVRMGFPLACVGIIDANGGVFSGYVNKLFQIVLSVTVQVVLCKLSLSFMIGGHLIWAIVFAITAVNSPRILQELIYNPGGGGGGAKMEPSAILVIKGDRIELFNIKGNPYSSSFDRLIGLVPDLVSKLKSDKYIYLNDEQ